MYIHKSNPSWDTDKLPSSYREAVTEEEYNNGGYYKLSTKQLRFMKDNPAASGIEIIRMKLEEPKVYERTLQDAINDKLSEIDQYDNSDDVNSFFVNSNTFWITADKRAVYRSAVESAELLEEEKITIDLSGNFIELPVQDAKMMLAKIESYASKSAIITGKHKKQVENSITTEEADNYNYKTGYPEKVSFTI